MQTPGIADAAKPAALRSTRARGPTTAPSQRKRHARSRAMADALRRAGRKCTAAPVAPSKSSWGAGTLEAARRRDELRGGGLEEKRGGGVLREEVAVGIVG